MINQGLQFIATQLSDFLHKHLPASQNKIVVVNNVRDQLNKNQDSNPGYQKAAIVLSVVNVEEDHLFKSGTIGLSQANRQPSINSYNTHVYCIMIIIEEEYSTALSCLSSVLEFFRRNPVFDYKPVQDNNTGLKKIVTDPVSLTFEQNFQLWQTIGLPYLPSVLYRLRFFGEYTPQVISSPIGRTMENLAD